jgi:hypothetical protein
MAKNVVRIVTIALELFKIQWLRLYAASRKVADSSLDEAIELFSFPSFPHPSSRTMAAGFTQPSNSYGSKRSFPG